MYKTTLIKISGQTTKHYDLFTNKVALDIVNNIFQRNLPVLFKNVKLMVRCNLQWIAWKQIVFFSVKS